MTKRDSLRIDSTTIAKTVCSFDNLLTELLSELAIPKSKTLNHEIIEKTTTHDPYKSFPNKSKDNRTVKSENATLNTFHNST